MTWFPFNYRDVKGWHADGLPLSTPSNEAARFFDAGVTQLVLMDKDPQVGSIENAMVKAGKADPDFFLLKVIMFGLESSGANLLFGAKTKEKIFELERKSKSLTISQWERDHLRATVALANNDPLGAVAAWEEILVDHPKDVLALHLLFLTHLTTGRRRGLRDSVFRVVKDFDRGDRFYSNTRGKLCFGYEQNNQYDLAMTEGRIALELTPRDIWAVHSVSHIYEETLQLTEGVNFLTKNESDWATNGSLNTHVFWHKAIHHVGLGQYEEALTLYDDTVKPLMYQTKNEFTLSDTTALMLRLEMLGQPKGVDLKDRWRELGQVYLDYEDSTHNVFYDYHLMVGALFGDQPAKASKVKAAVKEQALLSGKERGHNYMVASRIGVDLMEATEAFHRGDYGTTIELLHPIRYEMRALLGGSKAQVDVADLMLLQAAVKAKRTKLSEQLLSERVARRCYDIQGEETLNDRILQTIMAMPH